LFNIFRLKGTEWLSLAAIAVFLTGSLIVFQNFGTETKSILGKPFFEKTIAPKGTLKNPLSVVVFKDKIIATSSSDAQVKIFSNKGKEMASAQLENDSYPTSLALHKDGTLFVATKNAIYKGSVFLNLKNMEKVKIKGDYQPLAVAVHKDTLLVFDGLSQKLRILNKVKNKLDDFTEKKLSLSYVNGIISEGDSVYVADSNGRRVVRLDSNGKYKVSLKNFSLPRGIAIDSFKRLHVVDTFANTIKVFDQKGKFLFNYGEEGNGSGHVYLPNGIAIDSKQGKVYVADKGNNRIQVWSW